MLVPADDTDNDDDDAEINRAPAEPTEGFHSLVEIPIPSADEGAIHNLLAYVSHTEQSEWIASEAGCQIKGGIRG